MIGFCRAPTKRQRARSGVIKFVPIEERVFIAVAGPVGLVAAANLVRGGVPVTVFEASPESVRSS